jgi:hypothetical protein
MWVVRLKRTDGLIVQIGVQEVEGLLGALAALQSSEASAAEFIRATGIEEATWDGRQEEAGAGLDRDQSLGLDQSPPG